PAASPARPPGTPWSATTGGSAPPPPAPGLPPGVPVPRAVRGAHHGRARRRAARHPGVLLPVQPRPVDDRRGRGNHRDQLEPIARHWTPSSPAPRERCQAGDRRGEPRGHHTYLRERGGTMPRTYSFDHFTV